MPIWFWSVAAGIAAADLITKALVFRWLPDKAASRKVISGFLYIVHSENRGGVFGLGQGSSLWLVFGLVAGIVVIIIAHRPEARSLFIQIALGLVFGGAVGNLFDRVVFGYVRDFILVYYWPGKDWPAFNVADSGISVGAVCLAVYAVFLAPRNAPPPKRKG